MMSAQSGPKLEQYRKVLRFVRRRVGSAADAEDVTQEVFANAAAVLDAERGSSPTLAWLYTVARRRIADELRRRERLRTASLEVVGDPTAAETEYGDEVARALQLAVAAMPEGQRQVVLARLVQGRSFAEIAREVGATEDACRMRFMRGLQHLRDEFAKEGLKP